MNGQLRFEGEYLNGKKHGKGKEYGYKGNLEFEGEYLNGYEIIGTRYNNDGEILCRGITF